MREKFIDTAIRWCFHSSDYGPGSGHIWLDDVVCTGEEFFVQDCNHGDIGENNCAHYEDVGLRCLREREREGGGVEKEE